MYVQRCSTFRRYCRCAFSSASSPSTYANDPEKIHHDVYNTGMIWLKFERARLYEIYIFLITRVFRARVRSRVGGGSFGSDLPGSQ